MGNISMIFLIVVFYILLGICISEPFDSHPLTMLFGFIMGMIATVVVYEQQANKGESQ